jgi:tetratricopeptide (TPR) repeat protein
LAASASARIWTDATGKNKIEAEYLGIQEGQVKLQFKTTGRIMLFPPGALSPEDQEFVKGEIAKEEAAKEAAAGPLDRFSQGVKDNPQDPAAYVARGINRTAKKDFDGAIKDFTKAIELKPDEAEAHNGRGLAYHRKKDLVSAQRDFNEAIRLNPKLRSAYKNRGDNLYQLALDPTQSVPELDAEIEKWQTNWNNARKDNLRNTPWQPLNATKGDVSRPAVLMQMAQYDFKFWQEYPDWGHEGGWGGHGGHGGHGPGCACAVCSGQACPHCDGTGCPACGGGKPAPGLGVYPPECMKGEKITLVANASKLAEGMPCEAKPGDKKSAKAAAKAAANAPKIPVDSVDFYRDVDGNGLFAADADQFLAADASGSDGFSVEVSTDAFPPGPQSYFAVPRGKAGSGTGASPEELQAAAQELDKAAEAQKAIAQSCEAGKAQGMSEDQSKGAGQQQEGVAGDAEKVAEKIGQASPEVSDLLKEAAKPMTAVKNLMKTAASKPGEACKEQAEKASEKANDAAGKLADAAAKLRQAAEAAKASQKANPGQAPADAAAGRPTSGANEILAAAPIGPRGVGGPGDGPGDGGDDDDEVVVERALEYIEDGNYEDAVVEYDRLLEDDPDNVAYLRDRAATQLLRGGYEHAVRDYDHLLEIKKEPDADLYYNRGCAHLAAGRLNEALSDFNKSVELNETWSLAYNNRGVTYARLAQYDKAIEDFSAAVKLEPGNKTAYRNRALAYKKLGEVRKAEADYQLVLQLEKSGAPSAVEP